MQCNTFSNLHTYKHPNICYNIDDWRCDQYRWRCEGVHKLPKRNPRLKKMYFNIETPNGPSKKFQRQAYQLVDQTKYTLVHYLGDSGVFEGLPHRGMKEGEGREHLRTLPSYMEELKQKAIAPQLPSATYKTEVAKAGIDTTYHAIKMPRNIKQVRVDKTYHTTSNSCITRTYKSYIVTF